MPNLDTKSLSDPTNFAKEYTIGLGQVFKDGTGTLPLIGNAPGSAFNSDPKDEKIFSGNIGIEIPASKFNNHSFYKLNNSRL